MNGLLPWWCWAGMLAPFWVSGTIAVVVAVTEVRDRRAHRQTEERAGELIAGLDWRNR